MLVSVQVEKEKKLKKKKRKSNETEDDFLDGWHLVGVQPNLSFRAAAEQSCPPGLEARRSRQLVSPWVPLPRWPCGGNPSLFYPQINSRQPRVGSNCAIAQSHCFCSCHASLRIAFVFSREFRVITCLKQDLFSALVTRRDFLTQAREDFLHLHFSFLLH